MATRSISIALEAKVQGFISGLKTAQQATRDFSSRTAQFARENEQHFDRVGKAGAIMGGGLLAGVGLAVKSFMDFDSAMSQVSASTHETTDNMNLMREAAIDAGAATSFSAKEAAQGIDELAKAGVSTKDILSGGLTGALSLAAAGQLGVADAAELSATALTQFKLQGKDIPHVADLLAAGAGKAQGSVEDIGNALKQSGLVASQFGLSIEDTTGTLAAFASAGLIGSDSGTSLKTMLLKLAAPSKEASEMMANLGIAAYDTNGSFVGVTNLAGQLKDKLGGLTQAQRDSTLATVFGTDAIRGANVLYEQGATGIQKMIDAVNESGYAATTAMLKTDNLAGDIERLGGSFDSVLIRGGGGAAEALRGLVQGLEDVVDSVGKIPAPMLQFGISSAGVLGAVGLLGSGFLTLIPKLAETQASFQVLQNHSPKLSGALSTIGKAAAGLASSLVALQVIGAINKSMQPATKSTEDFAQAFLTLKDGTKDVDALVRNLRGTGTQINGVGDALARRINFDWWDELNNKIGDFAGGTSKTQEIRDSIVGIDNTLAGLATNGGAAKAAESFKALAAEADKSAKANGGAGASVSDLLKIMPEYTKALQQQATAAGVHLSDQELLDMALGKLPASMQAAAGGVQTYTTAAGLAVPVTEAMTKALEDIGLDASGAVVALDKYASALVRAGLSNLSVSDAARNVQASIDAVTSSIVTNGATLDINTAAGRANQAALEGVASAGLQQVETMSKATDAYGKNIYSSDQLQTSMYNTYQAMIAAAGQFGIVGDAADTLARKALGIPPKVDVNAYLHDFASQQLDNVGIKVAGLDGKTSNVYVNFHETTFQSVIRSVSNAPDEAPVGAGTVLAPGKSTGVKRAIGGAIIGPGTGTSDDIPALLSNGEHVLTAAEVARMGGQAAVYRFRALLDKGVLPKFAAGGAAEKAKARRETWLDYQRDSRRGNGYRTVADSASAANSFADKLTSLADSGNVSATAIRNLYTAAGRGEAGLRSLHARADRLATSLTNAKSRLDDLNQVRDGVRKSLSGEFSIGDAMKNTSPFSAITVGGIQGAATSVLARIRTFAGKLNKLRAMGYSGAVLQEIAGLGSVEGMVAADALLKGSKSDVKNLNGTYTAIDSASKAAGTYVTDAMYKGGVNAAAGLVKGLQSQEKAIQSQMMRIGLGMESALKKALGIHSPSRKAKAIGDNFAGTLADRLAAGVEPVAKQAAALGDAISVKPQGYTPASQYRPASIASSLGGVTVIVTNPFTGEEVQGIVASVSHGVAKGVVSQADSQSQYTRTGRR